MESSQKNGTQMEETKILVIQSGGTIGSEHRKNRVSSGGYIREQDGVYIVRDLYDSLKPRADRQPN